MEKKLFIIFLKNVVCLPNDDGREYKREQRMYHPTNFFSFFF